MILRFFLFNLTVEGGDVANCCDPEQRLCMQILWVPSLVVRDLTTFARKKNTAQSQEDTLLTTRPRSSTLLGFHHNNIMVVYFFM